jgi:hypothetical protein
MKCRATQGRLQSSKSLWDVVRAVPTKIDVGVRGRPYFWQQAPVHTVLPSWTFDVEDTMVIWLGHTPGLKVGYVFVYCAGAHEENDRSIQPLLGVSVLMAPKGVGVAMNTA